MVYKLTMKPWEYCSENKWFLSVTCTIQNRQEVFLVEQQGMIKIWMIIMKLTEVTTDSELYN
jgi:hypothetical protein